MKPVTKDIVQEMSKIGKSTETQSRLMALKCWEKGRMKYDCQ